MDGDAMIAALRAAGPRPELADRPKLSGRSVGAWEVSIAKVRPDGTRVDVEGEWHLGRALEGRAVMDVAMRQRPG